jgi:hypothetical protein
MLRRGSTFHVYVQCFASLLPCFFDLYSATTTKEVTKPSLLPPLPIPPSPSTPPPPSTMAPRFYKKLKTKVKDLVTKMSRALKGRSNKYSPYHLSSASYSPLSKETAFGQSPRPHQPLSSSRTQRYAPGSLPPSLPRSV